MTTIVYDGQFFAADTRATIKANGPRYLAPAFYEVKKLHLPAKETYFSNERVVAMAGAGSSLFVRFMMETIEERANPELVIGSAIKQSQSLATVLILTERSAICLESTGVYINNLSGPVAIGSGAKLALAALESGKHAMEAIQIASKSDPKTNDLIDFIELTSKETPSIQRYQPN